MNLKYLLASVIVSATVSANAADTIDLGEIQPGVVYEYDMLVPVMGHYTPVESGVLKSYYTGDELGVYKDAAHEDEIFSQQSFYTASGEKARVYSVTEGETLYFYHPNPISGGVFRFVVEKEQIELGLVEPSPENVLSISSAYRLELAFNMSIKCTRCFAEVNGVSAEISPTVVDSYITVNWFNTLRQWYHDGKINAGDELTLTLTGIRDEYNSSNRPDFGDGPGKLVLKYKMAGAPVELIREVGTPNSGVTDFLTYYLPGSNDGIVTLIFNGEIDPDCHPSAEIEYGDPDNIDAGMYHEKVPVNIDRNKVTVNLQGVTRFPEEMIPGLQPQSTISLIVSNIKSADGQNVLTGYAASPYSFGYSYNLKSLVYSIAADWMPAAGSPLKSGDDMEMWVLNGQKIRFESVDFSFIKDGVANKVSVPYSDLTSSVDSADAMLYNFKAPAIDADVDTEITVTLGGLLCADGLDHSSDIFVRYKSSPSAVEGIQAADSDNIFYDLTGRKVKTPSKGIYITNGKKIVVQ